MSSFGIAIASNLAVALCLALVATGVGWNGRRFILAHMLWLAVLVKLVTPPMITAPFPIPSAVYDSLVSATLVDWNVVSPADASRKQHSSDLAKIPKSASRDSGVSSPASGELASSIGSRTMASRPFTRYAGLVLIGLWFAVAIYLVAMGCWRFFAFARLLQRVGTIDDGGSSIVSELVDGRRGPKLLLLPARVSPMLFGIGWWTYVVCPEDLWRSLTQVERRAFLAHETAHFLRRDHWKRWLEWFVGCVYWWNPIAIVAQRQLERFEEFACDAWAVEQTGGKRRQYAETLLHVVDYMEQGRVASPRHASALQPQNLLEQRLKLLTKSRSVGRAASARPVLAAVCCIVLLFHPSPFPMMAGSSGKTTQLASLISPPQRLAEQADGMARVRKPVELPPSPQGWWTQAPKKRWAAIKLDDLGTQIVGEAGKGLRIVADGQEELRFENCDLACFAVLPGGNRIVVGDASGNVRVWDLRSRTAVSLIGKHPKPVESVSFHPTSGLVSGDSGGTVLHWNIDSGQVLGSWAAESGPIQSVRWSTDGTRLGILVGHWSEVERHKQFVELKQSMQVTRTAEIASTAAAVLQLESSDWLTVSWCGSVTSVPAQPQLFASHKELLYTLDKTAVSSLVFCEEAALPAFIAAYENQLADVTAVQSRVSEAE